MNLQLTLPIDCVVLQSPSAHTFQSTPLYLIPNPLQALAIHSGCHLGRFPYVPFSFNLVSYILQRYYNLSDLPRFPPYKRFKVPPRSDLQLNGTDYSGDMFASPPPAPIFTPALVPPSSALPTPASTLLHPDPASQTTTTITTTAPALPFQSQSFLEQIQRVVTTSTTTSGDPMAISPTRSLDLTSIFLLSSAEVSFLLSKGIIRLVSHSQIYLNPNFPAPFQSTLTSTTHPGVSASATSESVTTPNPDTSSTTHSNISPSLPPHHDLSNTIPQSSHHHGHPSNQHNITITSSVDKRVDIVDLFAQSSWRLAQCVRYACANTVYKYRPYHKHSLLPSMHSGSKPSHPSSSQDRLQPSPPHLQCPLHPHPTFSEQSLPNDDPQQPAKKQQHMPPPSTDPACPPDATRHQQRPAPPQPSQSPPSCLCPIVNIHRPQSISRLIELPITHPPHDHSSFTFLYPTDLSTSFAARQPFQVFSGYNNAMIQRTIHSSSPQHPADSTITTSTIPPTLNIPPNTGKDTNTITTHQPSDLNPLPVLTSSSRPLPPSAFGENRTLSIFSGQSEPVIGFSSRVSKDHYKVLVVVRPIYTAPISAYLESPLPGNTYPADQTEVQPVISPVSPDSSPATTPLAPFTSTTTQSDFDFLFGSPDSTPLPQHQSPPRQNNHTQSSSGSVSHHHDPSQHTMLVANRIKFSHYSNRVPVHLAKE